MRKLFNIGVLIGIALLTSCEKNINLDLNKANPKYVIEAKLYHGEQPFVVSIKKTTDYYGKEQQAVVDNATIYLHEIGGDSVFVSSVGDGYYSAQVNTSIGKAYRLKVAIDGKTYTAETYMPAPVSIDSMETKKKDESEDYRLSVSLSDIANQPNYYSILLTINDTLLSTANNLYLFDDRLNDGHAIHYDVMRTVHKNDRVKAELISMDSRVYNYFKSLYYAANNDTSPAPANPNSNFGSEVLGYFGAFSSTTKSVTVQ